MMINYKYVFNTLYDDFRANIRMIKKRINLSRIGNLSNYDMDFDEDDINGPEGRDDYDDNDDDEPDYEDLVERKREDEEWKAEHAWHGNYHYPNDGRW